MKYAAHVASIALFTAGFTHSSAQVSDPFLGTKGNFLKSGFCGKVATCTATGTLRLTGYLSSEEYYSVKPKQKQAYGLSAYTVFFSRDKSNTVVRAGIRYPAAQDYSEDGSFARDFFSFTGGIPLHAIDGIKLQSHCSWMIKAKTNVFALVTHVSLPLSGLGEQLLLMSEFSGGERLFAKQSTSTRVLPGECAQP